MSRFWSVNARGVLLGLAIAGSPADPARGQAPAPSPAPAPAPAPAPINVGRGPEEVATVGQNARGGRPSPDGLAAPGVLRASARFEGMPSPGLRVTLDGSASSGGRTWYRWLQTQGPKATIDDPTKAEAHFIVPTEAKILGFVLVVGDRTGVDARSVLIEVEDPERESDDAALKADAGDDQAARVGRLVVLNGVRSEPKGRLKFRWIQAGGPKVALKATDGPTCSFVPAAPGLYQFALVVATAGGALSEASTVGVTVTGTARAAASAGAAESQAMAIDELARSSLASIEGGPRYADDLSRVFDTVADRMDTFKTYLDAAGEMTRRLDSVVPRDKDRRAVWVEQLFTPLMAKVAAGMKSEGVDLTQPEAQGKPLTKGQRARLAEQFRYTAAGLRSTRTLR